MSEWTEEMEATWARIVGSVSPADEFLYDDDSRIDEAILAADARMKALERVKDAAFDMAERCPLCGGRGYTEVMVTGMVHNPDDPGGEPIPMPMAEKEQCENCAVLRAALAALGKE